LGHDISGYNKAREEIAYIRFSMGNPYATTFYGLFDAYEYNGGVSGLGRRATYSISQVEKALEKYNQVFQTRASNQPNDEFSVWQRKEIREFIEKCLDTARKEGSVDVVYG